MAETQVKEVADQAWAQGQSTQSEPSQIDLSADFQSQLGNDKLVEINSGDEDPIAIIVGSFLVLSNADRMEKRLKSMGMPVYRGLGPVEFNRVGVQLSQIKENPDLLLKRFQREIAVDSWYLYPKDEIKPIDLYGFIQKLTTFHD